MRRYSPSCLELPSIGWQLFILDSSQSDPITLPAFLDTYATRLLTEPLKRRSGGGGEGNYAAFSYLTLATSRYPPVARALKLASPYSPGCVEGEFSEGGSEIRMRYPACGGEG